MAKPTLKCGNSFFIKGERPIIMGIINVTPDSFSDGSDYFSHESAVQHGLALMAQGADVLDVGGVSTAPNSAQVSADEEARRVLPVIDGLVKKGVTAISLDTSNGRLAEEGLKRGVAWINDQSAGLNDPKMIGPMLKAQAVVLMHSRGEPGVQAGESIAYEHLFAQMRGFFAGRIAELSRHGLMSDKIIVDPGIGFGKGLTDSLKIIANMGEWAELTPWSLIGVSRKSFLGKLTGIASPKNRDFATLGAQMAAWLSGADIIRTHNVQAMHEMSQVFGACVQSKPGRVEYEDLYQTR